MLLKITKPRKGGDGVGGDNRARHGGSKIDGSAIKNIEVDGDEGEVDEVGKKGWKISKSKKTGAKLAFTKLRPVFLKTSIVYHFDPEHHIWIETDVSGYAIGGVLNQLTLDDLGRWYPVTFFSCKLILAEIRYESYNGEFLAIVETFKTLRYYLEDF